MKDDLKNGVTHKSGASIIEKIGIILLILINIPLLWMATTSHDWMGWGVLIFIDFIPFCIIILAALSKNRNSKPSTGMQITAKTILNIICALISIKIVLVLVSMLF